jgi:hypothetical protein
MQADAVRRLDGVSGPLRVQMRVHVRDVGRIFQPAKVA